MVAPVSEHRGGVVAGLRVPARLAGTAPLRVGVLALAVGLTDAVADPHRTHIPLCPFHAFTGLDCPLCGSLRAVHDLTRLRLAAAAHDNVLLLAALPLLVAWWLAWLRADIEGRSRPVLPRWATVLVVGLAIGFAVVRNLPSGAAMRAT